jgi:hypothetical protein
MAFITAQRNGDGGGKVVSIDRSTGSPRIRGSSVSDGRDDTSVTRNPVPRGLVTRHQRSGPRRRAPLVRTPTLPKVLSPVWIGWWRQPSGMSDGRDAARRVAPLRGARVAARDVRKVFISMARATSDSMSARFFTTLI